MTEIGFYHLTRSKLIEALPLLLARTLDSNQRAAIRCPSEASAARLDAALWDVPGPVWLPHGSAAEGDPDLQPIWIAPDDAAPNGARFLFLIEGAESARAAEFDRVFDLFDGTDPHALAAARGRWQAARAAGHAPIYWRQGPRGWERGAGS